VPRKRKAAVVGLFAKLAKHIGHDVAGDVTADELVSFKESFVQAVKRGELDSTTVANRCQTLRTIFRWAADNNKITSNPAAKLKYTAIVDPRKERQDFSADDMKLILTECRKHHNPVIRISNLIAAFSGARLAEIVEANTLDFRTEGEHLVFHIRLDNRGEGETLKNEGSARRFPLRPGPSRAERRRGDPPNPAPVLPPPFSSGL
jgi:integrase